MKPHKLWSPLPPKQWTRNHARHLCSRIGYSVHPTFVDRVFKLGPEETVKAFFAKPVELPELSGTAEMMSLENEMRQKARMSGTPLTQDQKKQLQKRSRENYSDFALEWYAFAANPLYSPQEKLVSFFQNVWVVTFQSVKNVPQLIDYQARIRSGLNGSYPKLCRALATSPAMLRYLDLKKNRKDAPNENFARELFELFTLGEGNYTERDIKEAARALTGYAIDKDGHFHLRPKLHDARPKTIFGKTANFDLYSLIDLIFKQPAAASFLPSEFCRFYLSDTPLPPELLQSLADLWRDSGYSITALCKTVFASQLFYQPEYAGNLIKSPEHFFLGLLQDFDLDLSPLSRDTIRPLRTMGQAFFNPPNVRGWVGGKAWINAATLAARRQTIEAILYPSKNRNLNADESAALERDLASGPKRYALENLDTLRKALPADSPVTAALASRLFASGAPSAIDPIPPQLAERRVGDLDDDTLRELLYALLDSPSYHLS